MRLSVLIVLGAIVAAFAVAAPGALATTGTGSGGGLTVTVSLPDSATVGAPLTVAETITNTTARLQFVRVTQTLQGPAGQAFSFTYPIILPAGRSLSFSLTFTLPPVPPGTYTLTFKANAASAFATTVVG